MERTHVLLIHSAGQFVGREQKYLWTGKAASPARAMPRLSPTLEAAMANSLYRSSVCGEKKNKVRMNTHLMQNDKHSYNKYIAGYCINVSHHLIFSYLYLHLLFMYVYTQYIHSLATLLVKPLQSIVIQYKSSAMNSTFSKLKSLVFVDTVIKVIILLYVNILSLQTKYQKHLLI